MRKKLPRVPHFGYTGQTAFLSALFPVVFAGDHFCYKGSVDLHCADGAEFLTAETADAGFSVDDGQPVFNGNGLCGADLGAFSAADAA